LKKQQIAIVSTIFILCIIGLYLFYNNQSESIKKDIYLKQSIELKNELKKLIKEKQGGTSALTFMLSNSKLAKQALLKKDKSLIDFDDILEGLHDMTDYKNIWIQIVDKDGYNLYRSWLDKSGDYMIKARKDIAAMYKNPKPIDIISIGKFDMSFKTMRPIYNDGKFIGMIEMITHFNSVAKKLVKSNIEPIMIVDEKYTKHMIKPFTGIFIGQNYIANLNASKTLMKKIEQNGIKNFMNIDDYMLLDDYIITTYKIPNINNKSMGYNVLFYKINDIDMLAFKSFELSFLIAVIVFIILFGIILSLLFFINHTQALKKLNILFENEKNKALETAKAKSEFLANMSHEIRTPLNAVLGFIDILKDETRGRKSYTYVEIIDSSSKSLLKIIEDILDFSKIESGKLDIDKVDFNTKAEFEVITHLFDAKCSQKNISLTLNLDTNLPQVINTDPLRIKQVISNLLSNAIKFTSEGKNIIVDINFKDNLLFVSVKDQGVGIAKDKQKHIFEAFSQEDSSTTRTHGGTGLGLSISTELVKLLGGELKLKSEVGIGSEFYFSIPAFIGKEIKLEIDTTKEINFENKKILLVEDNKANQMFMKVVFKKMQLEYDIANDGLEAIEQFKNIASSEAKYDCILMDENMPNMNGIEATKHILEYEKINNLNHTPIVALTANALKGDRERFLSAGMDEYMTKPVDRKKLGDILRKFL